MNADDGLSTEAIECVLVPIRQCLGSNRSIVSTKRVSGGCISDAFQIVLDDQTALFVKMSSEAVGSFDVEVNGLEMLRSTNTIAVPDVIAIDSKPAGSILILEWIQPCRPQSEFWQRFGHQLAALHQNNQSEPRFGYSQPNFLGATRQTNTWANNWVEFFGEHRLCFQANLAMERGLIDATERKGLDRLINQLPQRLAIDGLSPSLLHGDLWSGNFLCDRSQAPVLIDPAVYFGHNECEFGMTTLFGGFDSAFYNAYHEVIPRDDTTSARVEIYQLYHLLNHVNLFGRSYWPACQTILSKYS